MNWILLALLTLSPQVQAANDGSGAEEVTVERLIIYGSSYTLVLSSVEPVPATELFLPALRGCELFTVLGSFDEARWKSHGWKGHGIMAGPTAREHKTALKALGKALEKKRRLAFVHLGPTGLRPISAKSARLSCVVESNSLELRDTEPMGFIYSYGDEWPGK